MCEVPYMADQSIPIDLILVKILECEKFKGNFRRLNDNHNVNPLVRSGPIDTLFII